MKRRSLITAAVFITAILVWEKFSSLNQVTVTTERGSSPLSLTPETSVLETKNVGSQKKADPSPEAVSIPELAEAREAFHRKLRALKLITREYNQKALQRQLTAGDERTYRETLEESKHALRLYELAVVRSTGKKEIP